MAVECGCSGQFATPLCGSQTAGRSPGRFEPLTLLDCRPCFDDVLEGRLFSSNGLLTV